MGAPRTIDRIVDAFPAGQQQQIRVQLSMALRAVISQQLVPTTDGGQLPVFGMLTVTPAVQNLIREGRTHQMDNAVFAGGTDLSMDAALRSLYREGRITMETALLYASSPETMERRLQENVRTVPASVFGRRNHS